jgi:nucleotide-binding universal stress UspA family protein
MNTLRSILVQLDTAPSSAARLEFAREFALRREAALSAMFVAAPPQRSVRLAFAESPAALLQPVDRSGLARTKAQFDDAAERGGPSMRWLDSGDADPIEAFCQQALYADLLVLGQHDSTASRPGTAPANFAETVLLSTGKPALVLPYTGEYRSVGHSVLIGWNATPQAARAVTAALPWLRSARLVHVLESNDEAAQRAEGDLDIVHYLRVHGIEPVSHSHRTPPASAGETLLSLAADVNADLLVMGCYGHSRAREFVLGGASRSVLQSMTLPVLMAH